MDDITDTEESLKLGVAHLQETKPKGVQTSTLLHIAHSKIEPNFYSVMVQETEWTWFIFPWNLHEDLRTLLPKTLSKGRTEEDIRRAFKDPFQVEVSEELVRTTLKHLGGDGKVKRVGRLWTKMT